MNENRERSSALAALITPGDADEMASALEPMLGCPVAVLDGDGARFGGAVVAENAGRAALILDLEPVGFLAGDCPPETLAGAARAMRWGLLARKAAEAKCRELSATLDARVREQTEAIGERQRQLYQAERLASIGQLAAGVAHEINNPLGFINSNLSSAERYLGTFAELRNAVSAAAWAASDLDFVLEDFAELLKDSRGGVERIARIVKDLKGFSSVDQPEEQIVDLNAQLASLLSVVSGQKPEGVTLGTDFEPLPLLLCLPGHLNQAFLHILQNALQAVGDKGTIDIRTRATPERITVRIADSGPGIPAEILPRIFDPFFTTHGVGSGTGLGLTVARDIVLAHGGSLSVLNLIEGGAVAIVELPV